MLLQKFRKCDLNIDCKILIFRAFCSYGVLLYSHIRTLAGPPCWSLEKRMKKIFCYSKNCSVTLRCLLIHRRHQKIWQCMSCHLWTLNIKRASCNLWSSSIFTARRCALRELYRRKMSVRPSVCPSHAGILSKRLYTLCPEKSAPPK